MAELKNHLSINLPAISGPIKAPAKVAPKIIAAAGTAPTVMPATPSKPTAMPPTIAPISSPAMLLFSLAAQSSMICWASPSLASAAADEARRNPIAPPMAGNLLKNLDRTILVSLLSKPSITDSILLSVAELLPSVLDTNSSIWLLVKSTTLTPSSAAISVRLALRT